MSNINSPAARNYKLNLEVFQDLIPRRDAFKLWYDSTTGRFSVQGSGIGTALKRTYAGNQSVTNDATFAQPIRDTFLEAVLSREQPAALEKALNGLRKLRDTYKGEAAKLKKLNDLLAELRDAVPGRSDTVFLKQWKAAKPLDFFSKDDLDFLHTIFNDKRIMETAPEQLRKVPSMTKATVKKREDALNVPGWLSKEIYHKYNAVIEDHGNQIPGSLQVKWLQSLPKTVYKPELQNFRLPVEGNEARIVAKMGSDFIYYTIHEPKSDVQLWRVYLNFRYEYAGGVLQAIVDNARVNHVQSFKIAGPRAFHARCDKIVAYVYSKANAERLAATLGERDPRRKVFLDPVPHMTIRKSPGIALGVEPKSEGTGLGWRERTDTSKSYGSIRSELLAAAVLNYHENKGVFRDGKPPLAATDQEAFLKCAVVVFQGYIDQLRDDRYRSDAG